MNRETKRAMARQQRSADSAQRQQPAKQGRESQATGRRGRLRAVGSFGGEVAAELRKVNWPDRRTVFSYTVVVLIAVTAITILIFGLDTLFGKAVLAIFG